MSCFIKHCKNIRRLQPPAAESKISFHRFPTNKKMCHTWLSIIGRDTNIPWLPYRYICSNHFRPEDMYIISGRRILKRSAIPKLNINEEDTSTCVEEDVKRMKLIAEQFSLFSSNANIAPFLQPSIATTSTKTKRVDDDEWRSDSASGSNSSCSQKRKQYKLENRYVGSPDKIQKRYQKIKTKFIRLSMKLLLSRRIVKILQKKVNSLSMVLNNLKSKNAVSTSALGH